MGPKKMALPYKDLSKSTSTGKTILKWYDPNRPTSAFVAPIYTFNSILEDPDRDPDPDKLKGNRQKRERSKSRQDKVNKNLLIIPIYLKLTLKWRKEFWGK